MIIVMVRNENKILKFKIIVFPNPLKFTLKNLEFGINLKGANIFFLKLPFLYIDREKSVKRPKFGVKKFLFREKILINFRL